MPHTPLMTEAQTSTGPYTWDDFVALQEDDLRELIDGELVEVEVPTNDHEHIVLRIGGALAAWIDAGMGAAFSPLATRSASPTGAASCPMCSSTAPTTTLGATSSRA